MIVPARDSASTLERTLQALRKQELTQPFEVIVVDDGSSDETPAIARRHAPLVRLIRHERGQGAGAARNRGAAAATAPVLAFTDADCFPTPEWLARGLQKLQDADLVQGRVEPDPDVPRTPFDRSLSVEGDSGFFQTANLLVKGEVFDAVGGFRDWAIEGRSWWGRGRAHRQGPGRTPRPVGEDTLFGWVARRQGARTAFAADAVVRHVVSPGTVRSAITDRWNWTTKMPGLARLVPELRATTFYRGWFFAYWSAQFDLAAAGVIVAILSRRRAPLVAVLPYARRILDESLSYPRLGPSRVASVRRRAMFLVCKPVVDAASLAGFLVGSVRWRSLLL